jgi:hypothetical protein
LSFPDRIVAWVEAEWDQLQALPFTQAPIADIRLPAFIDTVEDLPQEEQAELAEDLGNRVSPPSPDAPAVCHLDTGIRRTHILLTDALTRTTFTASSATPARQYTITAP